MSYEVNITKNFQFARTTSVPEAIVAGWLQVAEDAFNFIPLHSSWSVHDLCSFIDRECNVRARCCCKIHEAAHCFMIWNLAADVFVVITSFATGRHRDTFYFSHVKLFQYLVCIHLLAHKDQPITLTLNLHSKEVLKRANCDFKFLLQ